MNILKTKKRKYRTKMQNNENQIEGKIEITNNRKTEGKTTKI